MEVAGNAIMTIIQTHWPDAMAASMAAGNLIYIREDNGKENQINERKSIFSIEIMDMPVFIQIFDEHCSIRRYRYESRCHVISY